MDRRIAQVLSLSTPRLGLPCVGRTLIIESNSIQSSHESVGYRLIPPQITLFGTVVEQPLLLVRVEFAADDHDPTTTIDHRLDHVPKSGFGEFLEFLAVSGRKIGSKGDMGATLA